MEGAIVDVSIKRQDVEVVGGPLAVYQLGAGPVPVLAVHGITASSRNWLAVARALAGRATLVAPDLRGRGRSNGLPEPYGIEAYVRDLLAVLNALGSEQVVAMGHSLGGYIVARLAADHPHRVRSAVLVDGGLTQPGAERIADSEGFADQVLGPALARLRMEFPDREAYHQWWREHPAFAGDVVRREDLEAYADHDLIGESPHMHSAVVERAVRHDAPEVLRSGEAAHRLEVPTTHLCAERGLLNEPNPFQPRELVEAWAAEAPELRRAVPVPGTNHYTLALGAPGAEAIAEAVAN